MVVYYLSRQRQILMSFSSCVAFFASSFDYLLRLVVDLRLHRQCPFLFSFSSRVRRRMDHISTLS